MSAKTSGADTGSGAGATNRSHQQGNQSRSFTPEQKTAVIRVRKCSATAFYEILAIEQSASDGEIKKAYRKLSLLTHPDKNGYEGADEAFKMVSRAFQVLSDADKKARYDKFGGDPDSRFGQGSAGAGGAASNPFAGFARTRTGAGGPGGPFGGGGGPMFEEELSPEEIFNRFFGGGFGGGFGPFGGGENVIFSMGGGPGIRVHQFGGRPRRRPAGAQGQQEAEQSPLGVLANMLPLLILLAVTVLSSLFSSFGDSTPNIPEVRLSDDGPPFTAKRQMPHISVPYWVRPDRIDDLSPAQLRQIDGLVEHQYVASLKSECGLERRRKEHAIGEASGWFFTNEEKLSQARRMDMKSCDRLRELRVPINPYEY